MSDGLPPHAVTAALWLAGPQRSEVVLHHGGAPEAVVTVVVGRSAFYLHTRPTTERVGEIWQEASREALLLPTERRLHQRRLGPLDIAQPSVVVHAAGRPAGLVRLGREAGEGSGPSYLHVQLGEVAFLMYDQMAFNSCAAAFTKAAQLGAKSLPMKDLRMAPVYRQQPTLSGAVAEQVATELGLIPQPHPASRAAAAYQSGSGGGASPPRQRTSSAGGVPRPIHRPTPPQPRRTR